VLHNDEGTGLTKNNSSASPHQLSHLQASTSSQAVPEKTAPYDFSNIIDGD
jgi:hypothetical protein